MLLHFLEINCTSKALQLNTTRWQHSWVWSPKYIKS